MRFILQVHNNVTYRFQFVSYIKSVIYKVNEASHACINSIELQCSRGWCYDILSPQLTKLSNLAPNVVLRSSVSPSGLTTQGRVVGGGRLTLFFSNTKDCSGLVTNSLKYTFPVISFEKRKWS